jgi:alanine racemase
MSTTSMKNLGGCRVWAEIRVGALQRNLMRIREYVRANAHLRRVPGILAVIKANAYGHGAVPVAKALSRVGADWFGVACLSEGVELRQAGIKEPILLLGGCTLGEEREVVEFNLTPTITDCAQLASLEKAVRRSQSTENRPFSIQLKINTGMNRLGIEPSDLTCFARALTNCPHLTLGGTLTHFASSEVLDNGQTCEQQNSFVKALRQMAQLSVSPGLIHMANSAALVARPDTWADMVRPGAALYGCHVRFRPTPRQREFEAKLPLEPVLSLRAKIVAVRDLLPGATVGYDAKFVTKRASRIAVLAAGYADGLMRGLSNRGSVLVRGHSVPIVGQISMDMAMIDVTEVEGVSVGDTVTIIGQDNEATQTTGEIANALETVVQDVLCALGRRVRRVYLKG